MSMIIRRPIDKRSYLYSLIAVILCARHMFQLLGFPSVASFLFAMLYILTAVYASMSIMKRMTRYQKVSNVAYVIVGGLILLYFAGVLFLNFSTSLKKAMTFLLIFPVLFCADFVAISERDARLFGNGITMVGALLAVLAFIPSGYKNGLLLLYTLNGNQCGLLYMIVFSGVFVYQCQCKKHVLLYGIMACLLYGCWQTESRTALLSCLLIIVLTLVLRKKPNLRTRTVYAVIGGFVALPFIISFLLIVLGEDFKVLGVSAWTGRERIWPIVIKNLATEPFAFRIDRVLYDLFGTDLGAHNTWLSIAWNYSVPVVVIFIISLFRIGNRLLRISDNNDSAVLIACFAGGILHMCFEESILCGALDYSLYFLWTLFAGIGIASHRRKL